jgi:hypothetical protein
MVALQLTGEDAEMCHATQYITFLVRNGFMFTLPFTKIRQLAQKLTVGVLLAT